MLLALFCTEDFGDYDCAAHAESGTGTNHNKKKLFSCLRVEKLGACVRVQSEKVPS